MPVNTQAKSIIYQLEQTKRKLHSTEQALVKNGHEKTKAEETIVRCTAEDKRLADSVQTLRLEAQTYFQQYLRAGMSWMKIEAIEIEEAVLPGEQIAPSLQAG